MNSPTPAVCCWAWVRWKGANGKSDGNRRTVLPSSRSDSVGALVPATPTPPHPPSSLCNKGRHHQR
jgi:hypothetical protein